MRAAPAALLAAFVAATALAAEPDHAAERKALDAALRRLDADLGRSDSATAVLQAICNRRAPGVSITATPIAQVAERADDARARADLAIGPHAPLKFRQVELACGAQVLSRAQNWYRPDRLTAEMNQTLETTRTPFGVVVAPLQFHRRRLSTSFLVQPLGHERTPKPAAAPAPGAPLPVLQHRAVLETPDGQPFSLVVESYTAEALEP